MKERPILFSAPMVRAILAGAKTQTRRVVKPQPEMRNGHLYWSSPRYDNGDGVHYFHTSEEAGLRLMKNASPYGVAGDRLWVRETWRPRVAHSHGEDACDCGDVSVSYLADGATAFFADGTIPDGWTLPVAAQRWKNVPAIHMPRWASRLTLAVERVRAERLHDISEDDAKAEGTECRSDLAWDDAVAEWHRGAGPDRDPYALAVERGHRAAFRALWSSINGAPSWAANPWVWVVTFSPGRS